MNAHSIGGQKIHQNNNTPCFYSASTSAKFCLFHERFKQKYKQQLTREHLTVHDDDDASLLPVSVDACIFSMKGKPTTAQITPQELPEPDDEAIAHVDNPHAELLR